ncbi:unnamed protein product [Caenorhabditis angaria]|uniref:Uncharacterized protein n=1 Tax=Caenorhabditis angaria TaxID=860376 RepID=A0A9P1J5V5_9PELO|nr:unnamed protein product [Caenorhabditis angaria]
MYQFSSNSSQSVDQFNFEVHQNSFEYPNNPSTSNGYQNMMYFENQQFFDNGYSGGLILHQDEISFTDPPPPTSRKSIKKEVELNFEPERLLKNVEVKIEVMDEGVVDEFKKLEIPKEWVEEDKYVTEYFNFEELQSVSFGRRKGFSGKRGLREEILEIPKFRESFSIIAFLNLTSFPFRFRFGS